MKINSDELKYIISEAANMLLNEITVKDAYAAYYQDIPERDFQRIILNIQNDNDTLLPETKWVLKLYKKKSPRLMEDLYKLRNESGDGYLDIFNRAKVRRMINGNQANLDTYKSIAELGTFVATLDYEKIMGRTKGEMSNAVHEAKDDIEKLYENDTWIILIPKTHEASCYWAQGAEWCTAYRDDDRWYKHYTQDGPLYMNINKEDKLRSVQFHFGTRQFMDYYDNEIDEPIFDNIFAGDELERFYHDYLDEKTFMSFIGEPIGHDLYSAYKYDYDYGEEGHDDEYAYFVIDSNLNRIAGPFDEIFSFDGEYAKVYHDRYCDLIDKNGELVFKKPMTSIDKIENDGKLLYCARSENSEIYFLKDGAVIETPYKHCTSVNNCKNFVVGGDHQYNVIDLDLKPIFDTNYYDIDWYIIDEQRLMRIAKSSDEYNLADFDGNFLWDKWIPFFVPMKSMDSRITYFRVHGPNGMQVIDIHQNEMLPVNVHSITPNIKEWSYKNYPFLVRLFDGTNAYVDKNFNIVSFNEKIIYHKEKQGVNENKIRETLTEITVQDASQKYYQDIPANDFMEIVSSLQGGNTILQPETKWALGLYKKKSPRFMEDLYKLHKEDNTGFLDVFKRAKERRMIAGQQADLNRYKSISELGQFVNTLDYEAVMGKTKGEISNAVNAAANNADFPYEDNVWKVVIPKSYEASCYWGNGTDWCTATRENDYYYNLYSKQGPLFININKNTGEKYQFHFES